VTDHRADATADACVDLIEDEGGRLIGTGEHLFERQHNARGLTT
jgi:hypothetical protein